MIEQASFPELKPISISQELSRQLELIRESKAKPNFGLQSAGSPLSTQPVTNANPFAVLETTNPEAEEEKDDSGERKDNWTFQGKKTHSKDHLFKTSSAPDPNPLLWSRCHSRGKEEACAFGYALVLLHLSWNIVSPGLGSRQSENLAGPVKRKKHP
jgi:hypothetical protein